MAINYGVVNKRLTEERRSACHSNTCTEKYDVIFTYSDYTLFLRSFHSLAAISSHWPQIATVLPPSKINSHNATLL